MATVNPESSGSFANALSPQAHVGRTREETELRRALDQMCRGHGGVVLVGGEAGIGKTTLVQQLRNASSPDAILVLTGHCYDLADTLPYGPWRQMFSSDSGEADVEAIGAILSEPGPQSRTGSQHELFEMVTAMLKALAANSPLVLVLEDIHWADRASLDLLRHVSHVASETKLLIVATYRTDTLEGSRILSGVLPSLVRESNSSRIDLRRLGPEDVLELVSTRCELPVRERERLADYLFTRAEGNPFFTVELMRDLEDRGALVRDEPRSRLHELGQMPIPAMVQQVVELRLQQLSRDANELLELASVIGQEVSIELLQAISGASEETMIATIQQAGSLHLAIETASGQNIRFDHSLVQETLYNRQPALLRRRQHRMVAEKLLEQPDPPPDHVAHHLVMADDPRAVEWLIYAGRQAEHLHAAHDASAFASRAIDLASRHRMDAPWTAYRLRARASETLGDFDAANQDLQTALGAARAAGDRSGEREVLSDLGMLWSGKDYNRAGAYYNDALDLARAAADQRAAAQTLNRVGNWYANTGNLDEAIDLHQQALRILEQRGDERGLLETHDLLGTTRFLAGDYRNALEHLETAISDARRIGDKTRLSSALTMVPMFGGNLDLNFEAAVASSRDPDYWVNCAREGLEISREIGWKAGESYALTTFGAVSAVRGDLGRGLTLAEGGYDVARSIGHQQWIAAASLVLGLIWSELEEPRRAELHLARCRATANSIGSHLWSTLAHSISGFVEVKMGDLEQASRSLSPFIGSEDTGRHNSQRSFQLALAHLRLAQGNARAALSLAEGLLALEDASSAVSGVPQVLKVKADALAALDRTADADRTYRDAERNAAVLGLRTTRWRIMAAHSTLLYTNNQSDEAAELVDKAMGLVRDIGETVPDVDVRQRFINRATRQMPRVRQLRPESRSDFGLSNRELDVLRLTAQGLTNAEIGSRLFISPRTVAQHLQSIYGKLEVNSRTAAAAFAHEHDLA